MNWSANVFFFVIASFAIYVIAKGDGPKWKQIFTTKMGNASTGASQTTPGLAPLSALPPLLPLGP